MKKTDHTEQGVFIPISFVKLVGGDAVAAWVLAQIYYWYRPSKKTGKSKLRVCKDGEWWIAKSAKGWSEETGLSVHQTKRAIDVLREKGLIEAHIWKFDGTPVVHVKLAPVSGKPILNTPEDLLLLYGSPGSFGLQPKSITGDHQQESTTEPHDSGGHSATGGAVQGEGKQEPSEGVEEGPGVQLSALQLTALESVQSMSPEADMKGGKNLQEVLKGLQLDKTSPPAWPQDTPPTSLKMAGHWRKLVVFYGHASFMHEPTATEKGQWSFMLKREEERLPAVVELVVRKWDAFSMHVKDAAGLASRPQHPSVDFLTKHLTSAVNWFLMQQSTPASVDSGASKPFVFVAKPTKKPTTISAGPTDWGAVEAEVLKGKDTNHGTGD